MKMTILFICFLVLDVAMIVLVNLAMKTLEIGLERANAKDSR